MNRYIMPVVLIFILFGCSGNNINLVKPGFNHFRFSIEQDGIVKDVENHEIAIKRKPFFIVIYFQAPDGIFLNASLSDNSYKAALEGKNASEITGFEGTVLSEELFNKNETLMLSEKSPCFWQYASINEHHFSQVVEKAGVLICRRRVSHVVDMDTDKETIAVSDTKKNELNLVIMKMEWNDDYSSKTEKKREMVKIKYE